MRTPRVQPGASGTTANGVRWRARGEGTALLLANGYGASGAAWPTGWTRRLQAQHRVLTIDVRGGGWSRFAPVPFTIGHLAQDVVDVLDAVGEDRAVMLGLSMGGMVVQETALRWPHRVRGLVLAATRPPVPAFVNPPWSSGLAFLMPPSRAEGLDGYYRRLWSSACAEGLAERHPDLIEELVGQSTPRPTPRSMLLHQMRAMIGWGHAERLAQLDLPTAVVHGLADRFSLVENSRALAQLIPGATLEELEGVGHLLPLEAPEVLDATIARVHAAAATRVEAARVPAAG